MKVTNPERGVWTDIIRLTSDDLRAIGNNGTRIIGVVPAGASLMMACLQLTKPMVGSTTASYQVGTVQATTASAAAITNSVISAVTSATLTNSSLSSAIYNTGTTGTQAAGTTTNRAGVLPLFSALANGPTFAGTDVYIVFTLTDANAALLTSGEIIIGLQIADLRALN
jgi:hypothetical protein